MLNTGENYPIFEHDIAQWQRLYPAVDVRQTLRNIQGWNLAHLKRRKTKAGILAHINAWLTREQNHAGKPNPSPLNNRAPPKASANLYEHNLAVTQRWASKTHIIEGEVSHE